MLLKHNDMCIRADKANTFQVVKKRITSQDSYGHALVVDEIWVIEFSFNHYKVEYGRFTEYSKAVEEMDDIAKGFTYNEKTTN